MITEDRETGLLHTPSCPHATAHADAHAIVPPVHPYLRKHLIFFELVDAKMRGCVCVSVFQFRRVFLPFISHTSMDRYSK